jgi:hypothetical protein
VPAKAPPEVRGAGHRSATRGSSAV